MGIFLLLCIATRYFFLYHEVSKSFNFGSIGSVFWILASKREFSLLSSIVASILALRCKEWFSPTGEIGPGGLWLPTARCLPVYISMNLLSKRTLSVSTLWFPSAFSNIRDFSFLLAISFLAGVVSMTGILETEPFILLRVYLCLS